jgi:hypothetical protein
MTRKNNQLNPIKEYTSRDRRRDRWKGMSKTTTMAETDKTTSTYISLHFGTEKTDECNKHQDSSVHW